jgi:putative ABC transport system substrate-binding protein
VTTRRDFFSVVAIGASLVTSAAAAQPRGKAWRLGYLVLNPLTDPPSPERAAFVAALRDLGYAVGSNLTIEYRSADADKERLPFLADELVQAKVDAIVVGSSDPARAAMRATPSIPIIMLGVGDPVAFGLVTNLARPGSNITGPSWQSVDLIGKRFNLLKEVLPRANRAAYLWNPDTAEGWAGYVAAKEAAQKAGFTLDELRVTDAQELQRAIGVLERLHPDALYVNIDPRIATYRQIIAEAAIRFKISSISGYRGFVDVGGLMSYGASLTELYRRAATYVDRVFHGAKPAELPIEQPTKFDLVINLKTATLLGLTIPQSLLLRADEVIQ